MKYDENMFKIENALSFNMYLCSKELMRYYNLILKKYDLTYTQYLVMMYFWEQGESNLRDIGKILILDSSTLTPLLKKLEKKGYITRVKLKEDERNLVLNLTKKGKDLRGKLLDVPKDVYSILNLSENERKTLQKDLYKILIRIMEANKDAFGKNK